MSKSFFSSGWLPLAQEVSVMLGYLPNSKFPKIFQSRKGLKKSGDALYLGDTGDCSVSAVGCHRGEVQVLQNISRDWQAINKWMIDDG